MYEFLRGLHNLLRWVVLLGGVAALFTALRGLLANAPWGAGDRRIGAIFAGSLHLQVLIGLLLYLVSPMVGAGLRDFGAAMRSDEMRFFLVEHLTLMVLAAAAAQIGLSLARRAASDRARFRRAVVGYLLAMALLVAGIPWGRSLVPWS